MTTFIPVLLYVAVGELLSGDDPFTIARWTVRAATSAARLTEVVKGWE